MKFKLTILLSIICSQAFADNGIGVYEGRIPLSPEQRIPANPREWMIYPPQDPVPMWWINPMDSCKREVVIVVGGNPFYPPPLPPQWSSCNIPSWLSIAALEEIAKHHAVSVPEMVCEKDYVIALMKGIKESLSK